MARAVRAVWLVPVIVAWILAAATSARADEASAASTLTVERAEVAPRIDGVLDDAVWARAPLSTGDWVSYNPTYGERLPQHTTVWAAYDDQFLYFAFHCTDPDPARIKTNVARRDNMWNDDWVGLKLDAMGDGQTSYDMFVNPSGVQGDILTSAARGESSSVDWVWDSAARLTADGYTVEIRLPLQSVRFKSGAVVPMRVLFWRRVSRLGVSVAWPELPPGSSSFERQAGMAVANLTWPGVREVIPSVTQSVDQIRSAPGRWSGAAGRTNVGASVKFGLTSAVTLDGTINPDFSQVESDAFQMQVNQRFPVFFSEKRPFFMEGMGVFELAGTGGDGNMQTAVHTRRIVDPDLGVKLSGTLGRVTFGTITAADSAPARLDPSLDGRRKLFNVARATYGLGPASYVGVLFTDTSLGGVSNRVAGGDASLKRGRQRLSATFLRSASTADGDRRSGAMAQAMYTYDTRRFNVGAQVEHYDEDFELDTAFYRRTGTTGGWAYAGLNFYPHAAQVSWVRRVNPFVFAQYVHDRPQGGADEVVVYGLRANLTRNGSLRGDIIRAREAWAHQTYDTPFYRLQGSMQVTRWLYLSGQLRTGEELFYDAARPFTGPSGLQALTLTWQPSARFAQDLSLRRQTLDEPEGGPRVYDVRIVNSKTSYQFTLRMAVRGILQYDSSRHRVLSDLLASYEVRPGTVFYAGYGALFEKRDYRDERWVAGEGGYLGTGRGLFLKASYLHRF
ncbi:MAG: carbohydrate binding family 9 domain-containing protein [Acidobacteria bacterium]|nr:carbohydrate binding family 9 domain-containing protein [Acidobacteriota bacterium]